MAGPNRLLSEAEREIVTKVVSSHSSAIALRGCPSRTAPFHAIMNVIWRDIFCNRRSGRIMRKQRGMKFLRKKGKGFLMWQ